MRLIYTLCHGLTDATFNRGNADRSLIYAPLTKTIYHSLNNNLTPTRLIYLHLFIYRYTSEHGLELSTFIIQISSSTLSKSKPQQMQSHCPCRVAFIAHVCYKCRIQLLLFNHCVQLNLERCNNLDHLFVYFFKVTHAGS